MHMKHRLSNPATVCMLGAMPHRLRLPLQCMLPYSVCHTLLHYSKPHISIHAVCLSAKAFVRLHAGAASSLNTSSLGNFSSTVYPNPIARTIADVFKNYPDMMSPSSIFQALANKAGKPDLLTAENFVGTVFIPTDTVSLFVLHNLVENVSSHGVHVYLEL